MLIDHWPQTITLLADLVVYEAKSTDEFLRKLILLIMRLIPVDSCLIYVQNRQGDVFTLIASKKRHKKLIGKIQIKKGEGITGWAANHNKMVIIQKKAYEDKRFKKFSELPEDTYEAFISIPIVDRQGAIGVINLQNREPRIFSKKQILTLQSIVNLISSAFAKITLDYRVNNLEKELEERKLVEKAKGVLMKVRKISENQAYQLIRSEAMKKRKSRKEIAEAILLLWDSGNSA